MFFSIFPLAIPNKVLLSSFNDSAVGTTQDEWSLFSYVLVYPVCSVNITEWTY